MNCFHLCSRCPTPGLGVVRSSHETRRGLDKKSGRKSRQTKGRRDVSDLYRGFSPIQSRLCSLHLHRLATSRFRYSIETPRWHEKVEETGHTALPLSSSVFHRIDADTTSLCAVCRGVVRETESPKLAA